MSKFIVFENGPFLALCEPSPLHFVVCQTFVVNVSLNFTHPSSLEQNRAEPLFNRLVKGFNFNIFNDVLKHEQINKQTNKQTNTHTNKQTNKHADMKYDIVKVLHLLFVLQMF